MSLSSLKNNKGMTLTELIVALGISSILLIFIVSGSLFVQNYLKSVQRKDKIFEELSFVNEALSEAIAHSRQVNLYLDSLVCYSEIWERTVYQWQEGNLSRDGHTLSRAGLRLDTLAITTMELQKSDDSLIFVRGQDTRHAALYEIFLVVSDDNKLTDSLRSVVKNEYTAVKYHQK